MKKFGVIIFLLWFNCQCFSQWSLVATVYGVGDCHGFPLPVHLSVLNDSVAYWYSQREGCSPGSTAYFYIQRTGDRFLTQQDFLSCGGGYFNTGYIEDVNFISFDTVYISYYCEPYFPFQKTSNGGNSWTDLSAINHYMKMNFINGHLGYGFAGNKLYRLYNDSIYLVSTISNFEIGYNETYFTDSLHGLVFLMPSQNYADTIIRTQDGGLNWTQVHIDDGRRFYYLEVLNDSIIYCYADSGYIYKTINGGDSWKKILRNDSLGWIHFLNEQRAYSVSTDTTGNNYYNVSYDAGIHWSSMRIPFEFDYGDSKMFNDSVGYIYAYYWAGTMLLRTTNNGGFSIQDPKSSSLKYSLVFPNPVNDHLTIRNNSFLNNEAITVSVINILGQFMMEENINWSNNLNISTSILSKGVYLLKLSTQRETWVGRFVKE